MSSSRYYAFLLHNETQSVFGSWLYLQQDPAPNHPRLITNSTDGARCVASCQLPVAGFLCHKVRDACAPAMPRCGFAAFDFDVSDITNYAQEQSRAAAAKGPPSMSIGQGQMRRTQWQPRPDETMTSLDGAQ
ncbi:hypothetical protein ACLKA7_015326 [Drosophila subpalustris]